MPAVSYTHLVEPEHVVQSVVQAGGDQQTVEEGIQASADAAHASEDVYKRQELVEVELQNDELKIDGSLAVCWSSGLDFTVERSTGTCLLYTSRCV